MSETATRVTGEIGGYKHVFEQGMDGTTLLLLHGTGADEYDLLGLGREIAPTANLLSPRGKVLENGRYNRFFRRLAEGVFDEEDIHRRALELVEFIDLASAQYGFDKSKLTATGFSNGANMASSIILLHPGTFNRAILFSAMTTITPNVYPDLTGVDIFIGAGEGDPIASPDETRQLAALFVGFQARVEVRFYPTGHSVSQGEVEDASEWLKLRV